LIPIPILYLKLQKGKQRQTQKERGYHLCLQHTAPPNNIPKTKAPPRNQERKTTTTNHQRPPPHLLYQAGSYHSSGRVTAPARAAAPQSWKRRKGRRNAALCTRMNGLKTNRKNDPGAHQYKTTKENTKQQEQERPAAKPDKTFPKPTQTPAQIKNQTKFQMIEAPLVLFLVYL
jgi:hypothetical protein